MSPVDNAAAHPSTLERLGEEETGRFREHLEHIKREVSASVLGQEQPTCEVLLALLAGGHVLIEGVPGVGKTLLVRSLGRACGLDFARVQCTPDLVPADVTGTNILVGADGAREFRFQRGPIFASLVLADEINRATPKTQSAFLEAMEERQVTVAGVSHPLPELFAVLATQNPIEMEGTFPLPEAQLDRFMFKVCIGYPDPATLTRIGEETTGSNRRPVRAVVNPEELSFMRALARRVPIASELLRALVHLVGATHPFDPGASEAVRRYVRYGASPRALQSIILGAKVHALAEGRCHVSRADVQATVRPALRHRLLLNFEAGTSSVEPDPLVSELFERFVP